MKKFSGLPLTWGCALLVTLLLVLAAAVLTLGRRIELQALSIESDSVPGLINGHTIRSASSESFVCSLLALGADTPATRDSHLQRMTELDTVVRAACDDYDRTILVDPRVDKSNYQKLLAAREDFLRVRTQFVDQIRAGRHAEAQQFLLQQLTPRFDALMRASDVLVDYNNRTGTVISSTMIANIAKLRWIVIAVIVLTFLAGASVVANLGAQRRTEQALARRTTELQVIFESAAIGIALVGAHGRPIRCNPAFERFLGYSNEELCAMTFAQFTHPDDADRDLHLFEKLVAGELTSYQLEKRYRRKDGATAWGHLTVSVVRRPDGALAYGIGMVEDISERKRAELALRESETVRQHLQEQLIVAQKLEAVGQLAGGVAHDFNNMLAAILLHLDLLKTDATTPPGLQGSLDEMIQAAKRAAGLTRQLLLFSRREPVQRQVVDLNAVVRNLLKMLHRLIGEHLTLVQTGAREPLWLHADAGMLEQVVMNLVVNARDAMPRGGRIVLCLETVDLREDRVSQPAPARPGRFVRLTVSDSGCGMSAATRARIFEPFFTTKEAGKGTGLGLATVFGIVQQHGGWIEVESTLGRGSAFAIYLPAHHSPANESPIPTSALPAARGNETILVTEDNEPVRFAAVSILRRHGYHVLEAADGRAAREILAARPGQVALLLSDVVMPGGLMGDELAAGLANGIRPPKVILMSGHNMQVDRTVLESTGCVYLAKPFDAERLLRVVRETLGDRIAKA